MGECEEINHVADVRRWLIIVLFGLLNVLLQFSIQYGLSVCLIVVYVCKIVQFGQLNA